MVLADEAAVVDVGEDAHEEPEGERGSAYTYMRLGRAGVYVLAVHAVGHAAMPGDAVAEILDIERALESRSEEAAKWCNERREACKDEKVELVGRVRDRGPAAQLRYKGNISGAS